MKNIELKKLKTKKDALIPQEDKYPSGTVVAKGVMWKWTEPVVGKAFNVMYSKLIPLFHTSVVLNIVKKDKNTILLETLNSFYQINILK